MYQIDVSTVSSTQPSSTSLGTVGYFTDGNAATGVAATVVPAEFLNSVMLELMNVITGAGLTLSKSSFNQLFTAIKTIGQGGGSNYAADTGSANAYAVTYSPTVAAPTDGMVRAFKVNTTNTGASTFALDGSATTYPIYGLSGTALQGGELVATGIAIVRYNSTLAGWVLYHCGLAPTQIAAGTASKHAATVGQVQSGLSSYALDSGTANTYVVTLAPAITAYADGVKYRFRALTANTGASTLNISGLGAVALVGGAHSALVGGEIIAGGYCEAEYNGTLSKFVLLECTGAALQVAAGSANSHAVNIGQAQTMFSPVVGLTRNLKAVVATAGTTLTYAADEVVVSTALGGQKYVIANLSATLTSTGTGANGISTSSAMPASGFLAIYAIYNPTSSTAALLGVNATSAKVPEVCSATMPTGYTASALIGVWPTNSSSQFITGTQRERRLARAVVTVLSTTTTTSITSLSISSAVPLNAATVGGTLQIVPGASTAPVLTVYVDSNGNGPQPFDIYSTAATNINTPFSSLDLSVAQTIYYGASTTAGTSTYTIQITSYTF